MLRAETTPPNVLRTALAPRVINTFEKHWVMLHSSNNETTQETELSSSKWNEIQGQQRTLLGSSWIKDWGQVTDI